MLEPGEEDEAKAWMGDKMIKEPKTEPIDLRIEPGEEDEAKAWMESPQKQKQ